MIVELDKEWCGCLNTTCQISAFKFLTNDCMLYVVWLSSYFTKNVSNNVLARETKRTMNKTSKRRLVYE